MRLIHQLIHRSMLIVLWGGFMLPAAKAQEQQNEAAAVVTESTAGPATSPLDSAAKLPVASEEQRIAFEQAMVGFEQARQQLAGALADQQDTYIRYINREVRNPAAKRTYRERRDRTRTLMDAAYRKALDVTQTGVLNEELVGFIVTTIHHRTTVDYYDEDTFEGAAKMLDAGQNFQFLYEAAARSAVAIGAFDAAEAPFNVLSKQENASEIDAVLFSNLERYRDQWDKEQPIRQQETQNDRLPRVKLETTQGDVILELFLDQAPTTVSHFIQLVEQGFYDGLDFYQVIDHALALTGDPTNGGRGNCGQYIADEHHREGARDGFRGSLVMAKLPAGKSGQFVPNSASSQFAILLLPVASIAEHQTVFGRVIEGMDVVSRLRRVDPNQEKKKGEVIVPADSIIAATVVRKPTTLPDPVYVEPPFAIPQ